MFASGYTIGSVGNDLKQAKPSAGGTLDCLFNFNKYQNAFYCPSPKRD
jgi:hypothetical protein